jgi:ADP-glucose pyrophosphorylase
VSARLPISNRISSGINKIYVLTQFNSQSLNRHLSLTHSLFSGFSSGFMEVLAASRLPIARAGSRELQMRYPSTESYSKPGLWIRC